MTIQTYEEYEYEIAQLNQLPKRNESDKPNPSNCGYSGCERKGIKNCNECFDHFYNKMHLPNGDIFSATKVDWNSERRIQKAKPDWKPVEIEYDSKKCSDCIYESLNRCSLNGFGKAKHCKTIFTTNKKGDSITKRVKRN